MSMICKFGGSSLADATAFRRVQQIVESNDQRRIVVVSASGKRAASDTKITDLLIQCHTLHARGNSWSRPWQAIVARYTELVQQLVVTVDIFSLLAQVEQFIHAGGSYDTVISRGEYLSAVIVSALLGYEMVDAAEVILFRLDGHLDQEATYHAIRARLQPGQNYVVPGFYGVRPDGAIQAFSRGGSDITGALIAAAQNASLYENWTDVNGLSMVDPRLVSGPESIRTITFHELRELSFTGATLMHEAAVLPCREANVPIRIRNTFCPEDPGTLVVSERPTQVPLVRGVTGRSGYASVLVSAPHFHDQVGSLADCLAVFRQAGISVAHTPTGIDTASFIVVQSELNGHQPAVAAGLQQALGSSEVRIKNHLALIAVVGQDLSLDLQVLSRLFGALARVSIQVRMVDMGSSAISIILGVDEDQLNLAVRTLYAEFKLG